MAPRPGPSPPNKKLNRYNTYLRYSGLGFQLLITIGVCGWLGYKLDQYAGNKYPLFMLLFGFLGFGGSMYNIYRSINRQSQLIPFLIAVVILAVALPPAVTFALSRQWLPEAPSFLFETTWLVACITTVIYIYLYRSLSASYFVQLYLLSVAVKLVAYFTYILIMMLEDRPGSAVNVLYFLALYFIFTAVEIAFLYRRISRAKRP